MSDKELIAEARAERDAALAECRTLRGERNTFEDDLAKEIHRADAALAAVERVQETLSLHNPNGRLVKEVLAALDGAPEPEEKS